jgi:hypothetical protein
MSVAPDGKSKKSEDMLISNKDEGGEQEKE